MQWTHNPLVVGSNPPGPTNFFVHPLRLLSAHSLLNLESIAALGFLVVLLALARGGPIALFKTSPGSQWPAYILLFVAVFAVYAKVLNAPFLYDDYTHISDAAHANWSLILSAFGPVEHPPGLFFRPFGFLIYWLNYLAAGPDPRWWHAVSLAFHAIGACLVFALARTLRLGPAGSWGAALLFAFSGSAVEPAAWIDARFDPMATGLVLASLLCVCRFLQSGRAVWIGAACLAGAAGFASKESAFCLPLLVGCLWFFRPAERLRLFVAFVSVGTVAASVFGYRWWALGGIGGYRGATGDSNIASFSIVRMLNAVFVRDWTILFFPVNWSGPVSFALTVLLCLTPVVLAFCAWRTQVSRRVVIGAMAMTICAALPVQHLLLIGVDLANTRYIYLLSVGWALLLGAVFAGIRAPSWRWAAITWMVALHLLIAQHNLAFWLEVHQEARAVCVDFGPKAQATPNTAVVAGLPQRKNGVVFLANGFPECVEMNAHVAPGRVSVFGKPNFVWNASTGRVEPVTK